MKKVIPILPAQRLESFQQCARRAWLEEHRPELAQAPEDAAYWQLQAEAVNRAARRQFHGAFTVHGSPDGGAGHDPRADGSPPPSKLL